MGCISSKGFDANNQPVKSVSGGPHYPNFSRGPARFTLMPRITRCAAPGLPSLHVMFTSHPSPFTTRPPLLPSFLPRKVDCLVVTIRVDPVQRITSGSAPLLLQYTSKPPPSLPPSSPKPYPLTQIIMY